MVVEGPTLIVEALASGLPIEAIYVEEGVALPPALATLIGGTGGVSVQWALPGALSAVLSTVNPQPMAALVTVPRWHLDDLDPGRPVLVVVEGRDPGNLGALWRTAEAAGFAGLVVTEGSVDPTNPKVIRASAGAALRLPLVVTDPADDGLVRLFDSLRGQGRRILATALDVAAEPHDRVDLTHAAIVLGNEARGLAPQVLEAADATIRIELAGPTESLNVAAAGAVLCFEALRQIRNQ